ALITAPLIPAWRKDRLWLAKHRQHQRRERICETTCSPSSRTGLPKRPADSPEGLPQRARPWAADRALGLAARCLNQLSALPGRVRCTMGRLSCGRRSELSRLRIARGRASFRCICLTGICGDTKFPLLYLALRLGRYRRAVDAFEPSSTIERVKAATGPQVAGPQGREDRLIECVIIQAPDLGQGERGTISISAVLNWADTPVASAHNTSGWPCCRDVDQNGIFPMRHPR